MEGLNWNYPINLIGIKVPSPKIHSCEICSKPIIIYGRMLPCKHIFCWDCATKNAKVCFRCKNTVIKFEQVGLGQVFMCTHDDKFTKTGCKTTYLSQIDLEDHVNSTHILAKSYKASDGTSAISGTSITSPKKITDPVMSIPEASNMPNAFKPTQMFVKSQSLVAIDNLSTEPELSPFLSYPDETNSISSASLLTEKQSFSSSQLCIVSSQSSSGHIATSSCSDSSSATIQH